MGSFKDLQWLTKQGTEFPSDAWQSGDGRDLFILSQMNSTYYLF